MRVGAGRRRWPQRPAEAGGGGTRLACFAAVLALRPSHGARSPPSHQPPNRCLYAGLPHAQHQDRVRVVPLVRPHPVQPAGKRRRCRCLALPLLGPSSASPDVPPLPAHSGHACAVLVTCTTHPRPSLPCPRLQEVTDQIRTRTGHLPGVSIAVMGCIVNGPGEMADADFG